MIERRKSRTPIWLARRARNALRARILLAVAGLAVFLATFLGVAVGARRPIAAVARPAPPDTLAAARRAFLVRDARDSIAGLLMRTRDSLRALESIPPPPPDPVLLARRDSIHRLLAPLEAGIARAETAPLAESYRALAELAPLRGDSTVRALIDSLDAVERDRDVYGALGGVDPVYVALTARIGVIGRTVVEIAGRRGAQLQSAMRDVQAELAAQTRRPEIVPPDTAPLVAARDSLGGLLDTALRLLSAGRAEARAAMRAEAARRRASLAVPLLPLLGGSAALAAFVAIMVALGRELAAPRLSDVREAEEVAGVRVIAQFGPERLEPHSRDAAPTPHPGFRRLYQSLTSRGTTIASAALADADDSEGAAHIAAGLAISAAREGRSALIVDLDTRRPTVAALLRVRHTPGISEIAMGAVGWPEAIVPRVLGKDSSLDIVPSGAAPVHWDDERRARIMEGLRRMGTRYDVVVVHVPPGGISDSASAVLPAPELILCAHLHQTRLAAIRQAAARIRTADARLAGLILWEGDAPPSALF